MSGRAVLSVPGRGGKRPAPGTRVHLLGAGLATRADDTGVFTLEGVTSTVGQLLLQHDSEGDGLADRQRLVRLDPYKPGPGKQVQLGDVVLDENALIRGRVRLEDVAGATGHAGSLVVVPEGPFVATTSDDGSFALLDLPPGTLRLAIVHPGYDSLGFDEVTLVSAQELTLKDLTLPRRRAPAMPGTLEGTVRATPPTDLTAARVALSSADSASTLSLSADGVFRQEGLAAGVHRVVVSLAGYRSAVVDNVLVLDGQVTTLGELHLVAGAELPPLGTGRDGGAADGGRQHDAGLTDGGEDGGSGVADGGSVDAGADPRTPTARFLAPAAVLPGSLVTLDGTASSDPMGRALVFDWRQVQGLPVSFSANGAPQPTTRFTAPGDAGVLLFELRVRNTLGLASAPAAAFVSVQQGPRAVVAPTQLSLRAGATAELDGRPSDDPAGGPLSFSWQVQSGALMLEPVGDAGVGARVRVRAGMTLGPGAVNLIVTNTLGLASSPVTVPVLVHDDPVVVTADAGPMQVVGYGAAVTLTATATSTRSDDVFAWQWAELGPDGGVLPADAGVSLLGLGATVAFTAPAVPTDLLFRATATATPSGLMASALARVSVVDDREPVLVASDPPLSTGVVPDGPWWQLTATFDELLDVASVTPASVALLEQDAGVAVETAWDPATRTVLVIPRRPLRAGAFAELRLVGLTDASPRRNPLPPTSLPFRVRSAAHDTWRAQLSVTNDMRPAPLITTQGVFVGCAMSSGACGTNIAAHLFTTSADAGLALATTTLCGCTRNEQRGHAAVGPRAYFLCNQGIAVRSPSGFTQVSGTSATANLRSLNTDGVSVGSAGDSSGGNLGWEGLTPGGLSGLVPVDFDGGYASPTSFPATYGGAVGGNRNLAMGVAADGGVLRLFEQVAGGPFVEVSEAAPVGNTVMPRGAYVGTRAVVCHTHQPSTQVLLRCLVRRASGGWDSYEDVGQGGVERIFDVQTRGDAVFVAFSQTGDLRLRVLDTTAATPAFSDVPGPGGAFNWNLTPTCFAKSPALQLTVDGVWLAFQENCSSQNVLGLQRAR